MQSLSEAGSKRSPTGRVSFPRIWFNYYGWRDCDKKRKPWKTNRAKFKKLLDTKVQVPKNSGNFFRVLWRDLSLVLSQTPELSQGNFSWECIIWDPAILKEGSTEENLETLSSTNFPVRQLIRLTWQVNWSECANWAPQISHWWKPILLLVRKALWIYFPFFGSQNRGRYSEKGICDGVIRRQWSSFWICGFTKNLWCDKKTWR